MNIITLLNQVKEGEIVLPAIQRDFVWSVHRVTTLLDSIMRGYPVGIALLWETYADIPYRRFVREYQPDGKHAFHDNRKKQKVKVVLDGQQRLQSLFVALYGSYDGQQLYFDVLSGRPGDDFSQERYDFRFADGKEIEEYNIESEEITARPPEDRPDWFFPQHFISVETLFGLGVASRQRLRKTLVNKLSLNEEDELRVEANLSRFDEVLTKNENILKASVIDENLPSDSPERKSEADVLEIFVRINRQGTPLSRSDLIFSILKLRWKDSAQAMPELVRQIRKGNSFNLDIDFVIRCLFAVSNLGTRFELELLRSQSKVDLMRQNFEKCCNAIKSTIDLVVRDCWCQSSKAIGGSATLIPFVYYLFAQRKHQVPNSQIERVRKAFYLLGFTQPFSRYADSRLGGFLRKEIMPRLDEGDMVFPFEELVSWVGYWEHVHAYGPELLQGNPTLALQVLQKHTGAKVHYANNAPEIDHIFPRSVLRQRGIDQAKIEHFANFWILAKGKNGNKSNMPPAEYFRDVPAKEMRRARINRNMLDYRRYNAFLAERSAGILKAITDEVGLSSGDFLSEESEHSVDCDHCGYKQDCVQGEARHKCVRCGKHFSIEW